MLNISRATRAFPSIKLGRTDFAREETNSRKSRLSIHMKGGTYSRETYQREAIPVGVLMLLQGSVTSVLLIWPEKDVSKAKDFARYCESMSSLARISFRTLSLFRVHDSKISRYLVTLLIAHLLLFLQARIAKRMRNVLAIS